jgi:hypothetical protein
MNMVHLALPASVVPLAERQKHENSVSRRHYVSPRRVFVFEFSPEDEPAGPQLHFQPVYSEGAYRLLLIRNPGDFRRAPDLPAVCHVRFGYATERDIRRVYDRRGTPSCAPLDP